MEALADALDISAWHDLQFMSPSTGGQFRLFGLSGA